jgi:circadian clock protein KaiC
MASPIDVTYLADTVLLLRHFEAGGDLHRAISVLKKRTGGHESTIRKLHFGRGGVSAGEPLHQFHGVLTGVPTFVGTPAELTDSGGRRRA